jgi:hypothetical protein
MGDGYKVSRSILVDAPAADVYPRIVDLHRWQEWSPWEGLDPDLQRDYSGADAGVGARYAWSGNKKAGKGTMEIVAAQEPSAVDVAVTFEKPFKSSSTSSFRLEPEGSGTRVTWTMTGTHSLFSRVAGPLGIFDKMIGKDFEKGLAQLKASV